MHRLVPVVVVGIVVVAAGCRKDSAAPADAAAASSPEPASIAARVNGTAVDGKRFQEELDKITQGGARSIPEDRLAKIRENVLNRLVEEELLRQEGKRQGVVVTDADVAAEFERYKSRFKGEEQFQSYLTNGRTSVDEIKARLRENLAVTRLLEKSGKLSVTEDEARQVYQTGLKMYTEPEQYHLRHLLIRVAENAPKDQVEAAQRKAEAIIKEYSTVYSQKHLDFSELAKKYSEDALTKDKGGDLGWVRKGVLPPALEEKASVQKQFPYEVNKDPVRSPAGFHILNVVERKEERVKPFEDVKAQILESLRSRNEFKGRRELVEQLRAAAQIEIVAK